jgi:2-keto-3-deoxy-L-rhamnonate aldolase RhmA
LRRIASLSTKEVARLGTLCLPFQWGVPMVEYASSTAQDTVWALLIETVGALESIEGICRVQGVD